MSAAMQLTAAETRLRFRWGGSCSSSSTWTTPWSANTLNLVSLIHHKAPYCPPPVHPLFKAARGIGGVGGGCGGSGGIAPAEAGGEGSGGSIQSRRPQRPVHRSAPAREGVTAAFAYGGAAAPPRCALTPAGEDGPTSAAPHRRRREQGCGARCMWVPTWYRWELPTRALAHTIHPHARVHTHYPRARTATHTFAGGDLVSLSDLCVCV